MTSRNKSAERQTAFSDAGGLRAGDNEIEFYTIDGVADALDVRDRTVRRWIKDRKLIAHRFGRVVRVARRDLLAFLAQHREG
jgi:excisionase family DNA binding protein